MKLRESEIGIVKSLVGDMDLKALDNLFQNIDYYIHEKLSVFVPLYNYCHYAVMPNHSHKSYSFVFYVDSSVNGYLKVEGDDVMVPQSDKCMFCAFSPNVQHQEIIEEGFSNYYAVMVDIELFEAIMADYGITHTPVFKCSFYEADALLLQSLKLFMSECKQDMECKDKMLELQIQNIVYRIVRSIFFSSNSIESIFERDDINRAVNYIYKNINSKISVDDLACEALLSVPQFGRVFKQLTGKTPNEYIRYVRVERAKILLKESKSDLTAIALDCGFSSSSYFSHCFIESEGVTPGVFRNKYLK